VTITESEQATLDGLRSSEPFLFMNEEARSVIESVIDGCNCMGCAFLRQSMMQMAMIEAKSETSQ
jgi:hypothetical protein